MKKSIGIGFFILLTLLISTLTIGQQSGLPPLGSFFGGNAKGGFGISPDGSRMAYLAASPAGRLGVWIKTLSNGTDTMITDQANGLMQYYWANDNRHLLYFSDSSGDENYHLNSLDLASGTVRDLTPISGVKGQNLLLSVTKPDEVLVALKQRNNVLFDVYRINLQTAEIKEDVRNPGGVRWWLADRDLVVRAAVVLDSANGNTILRVRDGAGAPWREVLHWKFGETGLLEGYGSELALAFSDDGNYIYVQAAFDGDQTSIAKVDVSTGNIRSIVASDPEASIWNVMGLTLYNDAKVLFNPMSSELEAACFNYQKPKWKGYNSAIQNDLEILEKTYTGIFDISSRDNDDKFWVVDYMNDRSPGATFLFNRTTKALELLTGTTDRSTEEKFCTMDPITIKARDGVAIPCYLTLPKVAEKKNLPMVLYVHGGPWARDQWGYDGIIQFLASRGYAVLQVNYRGSTGFGRSFLNAGMRQLGTGTMQHDLTDAVTSLTADGTIDPTRVAIMGASYGGYATLAGLAFTPDLYASGIALCGISNFKSFIGSIPPGSVMNTTKVRWIKRVGDVIEDTVFNQAISPYYHVKKIKGKLMIAHGSNDPRVNITESDQMVEIMRANNIDVSYAVYNGEGHGLRSPLNLFDFFSRVDEFLGKTLNVKYEPWQKVDGSTVELK